MDSPCIKQTVCKVLKIFQHGKYLVAYVLQALQTIQTRISSLSYMKLSFCVPAHFLYFFLLSTGKHTRRHPDMDIFGFLGRKSST